MNREVAFAVAREADTLIRLFVCETAAEVASLLRERGVRGIPCNKYYCAIVAVMEQAGARNVVVDRDRSLLRWLGADECVHELPLTTALRQFVQCFDDGEYPELVNHRELAMMLEYGGVHWISWLEFPELRRTNRVKEN